MDEAYMFIIKFYYNFLQYPVLHSFEKQKINRSDINIMKNLRTIDSFMNFMVDIIKENGLKNNKNLHNAKIKCKKFNVLDFEHFFIYEFFEKINTKISDELEESLIIIVYDDNSKPYFSTYIPIKKIPIHVLQSYLLTRKH